jgi:hypothetical protein
MRKLQHRKKRIAAEQLFLGLIITVVNRGQLGFLSD